MKKDFAIITCVRNESYFLPIWLAYYSKYFTNEDIYVIDNDSTDGSTDNLSCNVIDFHTDYFTDTPLLTKKVNELHTELLEDYEFVIYTDIDEMIVPKDGSTLGEFLQRALESDRRFYTCTGYNVYHVADEEPDIDLDKPILRQRKYMFKDTGYDKTLISRVQPNWGLGFHDANNFDGISVEDEDGNVTRIFETGKPNHNDGIYLLHLHYFDFKIHHSKKMSFAGSKIHPHQGHISWQNKIFDEEELTNHFYGRLADKSLLEEIPELIKDEF